MTSEKLQITNKTQMTNDKLIRFWILSFIWILTFGFWIFWGNQAFAVSGVTLDPSQTLYSARQIGLGGLSVAFSEDANGIFSNPAGLSRLAFPQLTGTSRKLILDETQYTLLGWAIPTDFGTFGMGYSGMSVGGSLPTILDSITGRITIDPSGEATSYNNSVIALSYSKEVRQGLSLGANIKLFNQSLSGGLSTKASAMGYDFGATLKPRNWLTIGTHLQNIGAGNLTWNGGASDVIGGFYKFGFKLNLLGSQLKALRAHSQKLDLGFDYDIPHNTLSSSNYHIGLEYFPWEKIAFRTGFNKDGFNFGVGLINGGFRFDYAYASRTDIPGETPHYFSLSYVGERTLSVSRELKTKVAFTKLFYPKDRFITDKKIIVISAEAKAQKVFAQKSVWTVTGISKTQEVRDVFEVEDLVRVSINNKLVEKKTDGTIKDRVRLNVGRNVIKITGYTSPEVLSGKVTPETVMVSSEVKVLRFDPFLDTPMDYWAIEPIALSVTLGLVTGYPNDTFKPEKGITRAELITLLVRSFALDEDEMFDFTPFVDVSSTHWATKYIAYGVDNKMVTGYPDGTFRPKRVLTRAEGITILARYAGLSEEVNAELPFLDLTENYWANKYIAPAKAAGLLKYLEKDQVFDPSAPFSRAEACEVLYRTTPVQKMVDQWWKLGIVSMEQPTSEVTPKEITPTTPQSPKTGTTEAQPEIKPVTSEVEQ